MSSNPLSTRVAEGEEIVVTVSGLEAVRAATSDLRDDALVAQHVAHQIPGGYADLQAALFLLQRDLEAKADQLDRLVQP
jgi:hypothetical protein